jgi:hypothetical protein
MMIAFLSGFGIGLTFGILVGIPIVRLWINPPS